MLEHRMICLLNWIDKTDIVGPVYDALEQTKFVSPILTFSSMINERKGPP